MDQLGHPFIGIAFIEKLFVVVEALLCSHPIAVQRSCWRLQSLGEDAGIEEVSATTTGVGPRPNLDGWRFGFGFSGRYRATFIFAVAIVYALGSEPTLVGISETRAT